MYPIHRQVQINFILDLSINQVHKDNLLTCFNNIYIAFDFRFAISYTES